MSYATNFDSRTSAERLKQRLADLYDVDAALIFVGDDEAFDAYDGPNPDVWITPAPDGDQGFACLLQAGEALEHATDGLGELELATVLCKELATRALLDDGGLASQSWILVTADGWHGRVIVDDDRLDEEFVILHALQPVPTEPGIPVEDPPDWQSGWYPDGKVPTAGFDLPSQ